jgi:hypothetical protein
MTHDVDESSHCERDTAAEIEITEAMIEAGVAALASHDSRFESDEDAVMRIFMAMVTVNQR